MVVCVWVRLHMCAWWCLVCGGGCVFGLGVVYNNLKHTIHRMFNYIYCVDFRSAGAMQLDVMYASDDTILITRGLTALPEMFTTFEPVFLSLSLSLSLSLPLPDGVHVEDC